jgi:hypothetical protein
MNTAAEDLLRPLSLDTSLDSGYRAMAVDTAREAEAQEWGKTLNADQIHDCEQKLLNESIGQLVQSGCAGG